LFQGQPVLSLRAAEKDRAVEVLRGAGDSPFVLGTVVDVPAGTPFEERVVWE